MVSGDPRKSMKIHTRELSWFAELTFERIREHTPVPVQRLTKTFDCGKALVLFAPGFLLIARALRSIDAFQARGLRFFASISNPLLTTNILRPSPFHLFISWLSDSPIFDTSSKAIAEGAFLRANNLTKQTYAPCPEIIIIIIIIIIMGNHDTSGHSGSSPTNLLLIHGGPNASP